MIVLVTKTFNGESPQTSFIDLNKVSEQSRKSVKIFAESVKKALADPNKYSTCPYHAMNSAEWFMSKNYKIGDKLDHDPSFIKPPCHIDASVTLFEDEDSDYEDEAEV